MSVPLYFPSQALLTFDNHPENEESIINLFKENLLDSYIFKIKKINNLDSLIKIGYSDSDLHSRIRKTDHFRILDTIYYGNKALPLSTNDSIIHKVLFKHGEITKKLIQTKEQKELSLLESIHFSLMKICNETDYLFLKMWTELRNIIISEKLQKNSFLESFINFIFPKVPNIFVFIFLLSILIIYRFTSKKIFFINTHNHILKDLKFLKKQIDASITFEENTNSASLKTSWFNLRRSVSYQPLEAKDITQRLIHILEKADKIPFIFTKIKFIFVFDELDKIMPHDSLILSTKEDEFEAKNNEVRYHARRKERVALILASMKYFLNSAKAKFIFIAGRDMYDAALAGISDRESSLDSIFNDNKIYVNSFYTEGEDGNKSDITSISEQYVCQFLIPEWYLLDNGKVPSLNLYNKYLKYFYAKERVVINSDKIREKIIITLKDYIVYLSYRSNGAPRKLSNLLERNVRPVTFMELKNNRSITVGRNNDNLYLHIGYYDQYKVSLISSLTTPVFLSIGNFLHEYSDKLLVSISYMLDHLYKFHKFGLSYRNLSLTPEIVDVNKEPQFREFLDKLLHSLSKNHLRPIVSGIYDYRFHSKISSEIKFLSRIDDLEGAALNFTLDESIELKRYFNKRLQQLKESDKNILLEKENSEHVNNLGLLHMTIGDLHFYDEEYQEAISHYLDAIQNLRQKNVKEMVLYEFVLFIRNKLKLALAFEKNKMFDNALMTYSEITDVIVRRRNIPMRKFGLVRFVISKLDFNNLQNKLDKNKNLNNRLNIKYNISNLKVLIRHLKKQWKENPKLKDVVVLGRLNNNKTNYDNVELTNKNYLYSIEDMAVFYESTSDNLITNLESIDTNFKSLKYNYLQSTGENIRILYQALLAKLHLIEKSSPDKLKDVDIIRSINEFRFIRLPLKNKEKRVIVSEFYNKLGDLLYFKNGTLNKCLKKKIIKRINVISSHGVNNDKKIIKNKLKRVKAYKNLLISPIDALVFYTKSLAILLIPNHDVCSDDLDSINKKSSKHEKIDILEYYEGGIKKSSFKFFINFFDNIKKTIDKIEQKINLLTKENLNSYKDRYSYEYLSSVANGIVDLAETLTSFITDGYMFQNIKLNNVLSSEINYDLTFILNLHYKSFEIYKGIGSYRLAKSQLLKILHICREAKLDVSNIDFFKSKIKIDEIASEAIKCVYYTYDNSHFIEGKKIKEIFNKKIDDKSINSNINAEINEIILLKWNIKLDELIKVEKIEKSDLEKLFNFYHMLQKNINPYSSIKRKLGRIYQLALKLKINYKLYNELESNFHEEYNKNKIHKMNLNEFRIFLMLDSIGANNEILKSHYLFGIDYITTNHIQLAKAHSSMAFWCKEFNELESKSTSNVEFENYEKILKFDVLNTKTLMNLSSKYHNNKSLEFNYAARNFHQRGEPLNDFIKTASYLDDFFNDGLIHFSISVERNAVQERENGVDFYIEEKEKENSIERDIFQYTNYIKD